MSEIQHYLFQTNCDFIFLEMFCLDPYVLVDRPFQPQRPFYYIPDITSGKEDIALSCVNEIDSTAPPKVAYSKNNTEMASGSLLDWLLVLIDHCVTTAVKYQTCMNASFQADPQSANCLCTSFLEVLDPLSDSDD